MDGEPTWNEKHYMEVDRALLTLDATGRRLEEAIDDLREGGAEPHLIEALERAHEEVAQARRRLMQGTLFAVPKAQLTLQ